MQKEGLRGEGLWEFWRKILFEVGEAEGVLCEPLFFFVFVIPCTFCYLGTREGEGDEQTGGAEEEASTERKGAYSLINAAHSLVKAAAREEARQCVQHVFLFVWEHGVGVWGVFLGVGRMQMKIPPEPTLLHIENQQRRTRLVLLLQAYFNRPQDHDHQSKKQSAGQWPES